MTFARGILVAAGLLTLVFIMQYRQTLDRWVQRQNSVADDRVRLVSAWLRERSLDAQASAEAPEVIAFLSNLKRRAAARIPLDTALLSHLGVLNQAKESYGYAGIYVLNAAGQAAAQAEGSRMPVSGLEAAAGKSIEQGRLRLEWWIDGPGRGSLYVIAPVLDSEEKGRTLPSRPLGAVALVVNPQETLFPMLTAETVPTASGETVVVAPIGSRILYISPLRANPGAFHTFPDDGTHAAHLALGGQRTFGKFVDYRGTSVLAAVRPIPNTGFGLVAQIDYAEAFADFIRFARIESVLALLLVLAVSGWRFGYRRKMESERASHREEEIRGLLESTPEGMAILDSADTIVLVNSRTEKLFGYPREELLRRGISTILPEHNWITRSSGGAAAPTESVFARKASGRRKDGTLFPCELSVAPVSGDTPGRWYVAIRDLSERIRMEKALAKTEAQYATLFNSINDAAFVFHVSEDQEPGNFVQVNQVACETLGYTREELLRRSIRDIHTPEELRPHLAVRKATSFEVTRVFETVFLTRDGRSIPVEISARLVSLEGGHAVLSVARDISERRRSLALLQESESRYRRFIERNAAAFIRSRLDGEILECNDSAARLLGYDSPAELKQLSMTDAFANLGGRATILALLQRSGSVTGYEVNLKRKDGTPFWALANVTLVHEPDGKVVEGTLIDITERKEMELKLRTIESLVEGSGDFIGYASPEGEVRFVNRAGREFIGFGQNRPVGGTHILEHIAPEEHDRVRGEILPIVMRGGTWVGETQFRNAATGALVPMWQSAFGITEPGSDRVVALATIGRDLTKKKIEEKQLRDAQQAAEAGNRAKSRFLAAMSHEIRTPMNGILGMARLLLASNLLPGQQHYVDVIVRSGTDLLTLINQILDLSKIEAGKVVLERLDFEFAPFLSRATEALAVEARAKGLDFNWSVAPDVPQSFNGDPARLRQVIVNLVGNAVKFTSVGSIRIAASVESQDTQTVTLRITVSDTGVGVPPEQAGRLFSPFVQADASTTRKFGGTGLGLSVSKQIVELMGGRIGFESQPNRGSLFWFTAILDKVSKRAESPPAPVAVDQHPLRSAGSKRNAARILAAEDHPVNREVLMLMLGNIGHSVDVVENGLDAVKALQAAAYDIVLMDCEMPLMDGFEATRLIRDPHTGALNPQIPVIAVTASAMAGDRDKCIAAGMDDYLPKPIEPEDLRDMLDKWLSRRAEEGQSEFRPLPVHQAPPDRPSFDFNALRKRMMGSLPAAQKIAQAFLQSAPSQLAHLREHVAARDATSARRDAHTLKGSAATVSALALRDVALEAEQAASSSSWEIMEKLIPEMELQLTRLAQAIAVAGREIGDEQTG